MNKTKGKRGTIAGSVLLAILAIFTVVVNFVLTGPLKTVMNMYFGKGEAIITNIDDASNLTTEYYTSDYASGDELLSASKELAKDIESEGIVLLKNENNALPLAEDETKVSLFGRTSVDPVYTGAGSAGVQNSPVSYKEAFTEHGMKINNTLFDFYANHPMSTEVHNVEMMTGMGPMPVEYKGRGFISAMGAATFVDDIIAEIPVEDYPEDLDMVSYNDAAIVFIGRVGGEGCDLPVDMTEHATTEEDKAKHYLELDSREEAMLEYVKDAKDAGVFNKIIVVCNTANAMELGFLNDENYGIDAAVWVGCIGDQGAQSVAAVLKGEVNPSGRLVDTYVSDLTLDPSFVNFDDIYYSNVDGSIGGYESGCFNEYEEGIYVGYRYYETAAAEALAGNYEGFDYDSAVVYPFGYGMSYTDFDVEYDGTPVYSDGVFTFNVKVTNNGTVPGKDVVELYAEAPYTTGGIEKSKVVLCGFAKTGVLEAGQDETVTITVNDEDLASYDYKNNGCYILDEGDYKFYLSENAHSWSSIATDDASKLFTAHINQEIFDENNKRDSDEVAAVNQFDYVSAVFTDTPVEGSPLNMSRADFAGTFPTAPTSADIEADADIKASLESVFDEKTDERLGNVEGSLVYTDTMPASKQDNGLSLIDLRGKDFDDPAWDELLDELDYEEVIPMLANAGFNTAEMLTVGKNATLDYDGPMGWSTWVSANGGDAICIGFPAEEILAATWNAELAHDMGLIIGEQGLNNGFNGWYAPAMNTHRSAFAGRNYEYYSEDGLLGGTIATEEVSGAMEKGVYSYLKHFALNDKENGRNGMAVFANEQAIREIYLRPFELCIKNAKANITYNGQQGVETRDIKAATAVMSSYNRIGTVWAGGTYSLMTQVLRNEWGFTGTAITDYFGGSAYMDPDLGTRAGNDIMLNTFADGSLTDTTSPTGVVVMRNAVHHVLYTVVNSNAMQGVASGAKITYAMATWQKLMYTADAVVAVILIAGITSILKKRKAKPSVVVETE